MTQFRQDQLFHRQADGISKGLVSNVSRSRTLLRIVLEKCLANMTDCSLLAPSQLLPIGGGIV